VKNDALIIDDLHHKYDKREYSNWILNEINLKIEKGELLGLLGPSGCGKTTLLRLIAGFEYPSQGRISLNDKEISSRKKILSPEKRNIGMVFQDYALFPHLTVLENVIFGLKNKKDRSRVDYLLNVVGLDSFVGRYPHELSGGQKQRLAIARALAPGTNFILLDEPFCSLDMHVKLKLRSDLPNILKGCNASGLMVTHDPEEAMSICDKVAVMNDGKIHQIDTPINLLNNPKTIFVSSFILGNNIINLKKNGNSYISCLGEINSSEYLKNTIITDHTLIIDELETSIKFHNLNFILGFLPKGSYLVGGYIRDIILRRVSEEVDVDIVVPVNAIEIGKKISENIESKFIILDKKREVVRIILNHISIDIANQNSTTIEGDLASRDFSINSIAFLFDNKCLFDPLNGLKDLENSLLRTHSEKNLLNDPLRILRCFRFVSELNFKIDLKLVDFIKNNKGKF